jgi:hypothetical protein
MIGSVEVKMQLYLVKDHGMKTRGKVYLYLHQFFIFGLNWALRSDRFTSSERAQSACGMGRRTEGMSYGEDKVGLKVCRMEEVRSSAFAGSRIPISRK